MSGCCSESESRSRQDPGPSFEAPSEGFLQAGGMTRFFLALKKHLSKPGASPVCRRLIAGRAAQRLCSSPEDDRGLVLVTLSCPTAPMNLFCPPVARYQPGQSFGHKGAVPSLQQPAPMFNFPMANTRWDHAGVERGMLTYLSLSWEPYPCRAWASAGAPSCTEADGGTPSRTACGAPPCPGAASGCLLCPAECEVLVVRGVGTGAPEVAAA